MGKAILIFLFILLSFSAQAVPPAPWVTINPVYDDHVPPRSSVTAAPSWSGHIAQSAVPYLAASPTSGTNNILVIRVQFQTETPDDATTTGTGVFAHSEQSYCQIFMNSVADFYYKSSNHNLNLNFTVTPSVYTLAHQMNYYGNNDTDWQRGEYLIIDALTAADADYNYNNYNSFMIFHAGYGKESSANSNDIWSMLITRSYMYSSPDGKIIDRAIIVPEEESYGASALGTICHEYGHELGLADLYDISNPQTNNGIGNYGLMGGGAWLGSPAGSNPGQFIGWSKIQLGWVTPTEITLSGNYTVRSWTEFVAPDILKCVVSTNEYFLIENRQESQIPARGIMVTHIDDSVGSVESNNLQVNTSHKRVHVEQADGQNHIDSMTNNGDIYDTYYSGNSQSSGTFDNTSNPNSKAYSGATTNISVSSFPVSSASMTVTVNVSGTSTPISSPSIAYPSGQTAVKGNDYLTVSGTGSVGCTIYSRRLLDENDSEISGADFSLLIFNSGSGSFSGSVRLPATLSAASVKLEVRLQNGSSVISDASASRSNSLDVDTVSPSGGTISINSDAEITNNPVVSLAISATGATEMYIDGDVADDSVTKEWITYETSKSVTLLTAQGLRTVTVMFRDGAHNTTTSVSDTITLDTAAPTGISIDINEIGPVGNPAINLTLAATGASEMYIDGDVTDDANTKEWIAFATTLAVELSTGDGTKTVTAKFRDTALNEAGPVSDTIILDTNAPKNPSISINEGEYVQEQIIHLTLGATNATEMWIDGDIANGAEIRTWVPYNTAAQVTLSDFDGMKTVSAKFRNLSLSQSETVSDAVTLDTHPPEIVSVSCQQGQYSKTRNIGFDLSVTGASGLYVSGDLTDNAVTWEWVEYVSLLSAELTDGEGQKKAKFKFKDLAGNETDTYVVAVTYDKTAPTNASVSVDEGELTSTTSINLTLSAEDAYEMYISGDVQDDAATFEWIPYATAKQIYLTSDDATKTVTAKFRDRAGNETIEVSDSIILDSSAPPDAADFLATAGDTRVILTWTNPSSQDFEAMRILRKLSADISGPADDTAYIVYDNGGGGPSTANSHVDEPLTNDLTYYYKAFARDSNGHYSNGVLRSAMPHEIYPANIISVDSFYGVGNSTEDYPLGAQVVIVVTEEHAQIIPEGGTIQIICPEVGYNPSGQRFDLESNGDGTYQYSWNTNGLQPGNYQVRVTLGDDLDGVAQDPDLLITMRDVVAPEIEYVKTSAGSNTSGIYPLGATVKFEMKEQNQESGLNAEMQILSPEGAVVLDRTGMTDVSGGVYIYNWDTSLFDETYVKNEYKVNVWLTDGSGNIDAQANAVLFSITNPAPPEITEVKSYVGQDTDNIYYKGNTVIIAVVEKNQQQGLIGTVEIKLQGTSVASKYSLAWDDTNSRYFYQWNTSGLSEGIYEIESKLRNDEMLREDNDGSNSSGPDLYIRLTNDSTPPQITVFTPQGTSVAVHEPVKVSFSETMWASTCEESFSLVEIPGYIPVIGNFSWADSTKELTFTPTGSMKSYTTYQAKVERTAKDEASNPLNADFAWQFRTKIIQTEGKGSIEPRIAEPDKTVTYTYTVKPVIEENASGIKRLKITVPGTHAFETVTGMNPAGSFTYAAGKIDIVFTNAISYSDNATIEVTFRAKAPVIVDSPAGVYFSSVLINEIGENFSVTEMTDSSLNVVTAYMIHSAIGEFNPRYARPARVNLPASYSVLATVQSKNAGYNVIKVKAPAGYPVVSSGDEIRVKSGDTELTYHPDDTSLVSGQFFAQVNGAEVYIVLGDLIKTTLVPVIVYFGINTPDVPGDVESGGAIFTAEVGNTAFSSFYEIGESNTGNADKNELNSNSNKIESGYSVASFSGEITPTIVKANEINREYVMNLRPVIGTRYIGYDYFRIDCALDHVFTELVSAQFYDGAQLIKTYAIGTNFEKKEGYIYPSFDEGTAELRFGTIVDREMCMNHSSGFFKLVFKGNTPSHGDSGHYFVAKVDNYEAKSPMQAAPADVNQDFLSGTLLVKTLAPCNSAYGEIVPAYVKPLARTNFSYYFELDIDPDVNTGVDRITFSTATHRVISVQGVYLNGILDSSFVTSFAANEIYIRRTVPVLSDSVIQVKFVGDAPESEDSGKEFTATVDNYETENPITVNGGKDIDGTADNSEDIRVFAAYPAAGVVAELATSEEIVGTVNGVPAEKEIEYTYVFRPSFTLANTGIDKFYINVPAPHTGISVADSSVYVNGEKLTLKPAPGSGEVYVEKHINPDASGTVEVTLGQRLVSPVPVKITFKAYTPVVVPGATLVSTFESWVDYSKAEMRMKTAAGNADTTIHGTSYSQDVITMSVPVNSITATLNPDTTYIRKLPLYTLQLFPSFKQSDSGIDMVSVELPRTISNISVQNVYVNEQVQNNCSITYSSSEIKITGFSKVSYLSPGSITVKFYAQNPSKPFYRSIVSVVVDDSTLHRGIRVPSLYLTVKGPISTSTASITPNQFETSQDAVLSLNMNLKVGSADTGVDIIKVALPEGITDIRTVRVTKDGLYQSPQSNIRLSVSTSEIEMEFYSRIYYNSSVGVSFECTMPPKSMEGTVEITVYDKSDSELYDTVGEASSGSLALTTMKHSIKEVYAYAMDLTEKGWDVDLKVIFETRMNAYYGSLYVDNTQALNANFYNAQWNGREVGIWEGKVYIENARMGTGSFVAEFRGGKDSKGNTVDTLSKSINIAAGTAIFGFYDPILQSGKKNAVLILTAVSSEENVKSVSVKAIEGSKETEILLSKMPHAGIYKGSYKLTQEGHPKIRAVTTDVNNVVNNGVDYLISTRLAGPKQSVISHSGFDITIPENALSSEELLVMYPLKDASEGELVADGPVAAMAPHDIKFNSNVLLKLSDSMVLAPAKNAAVIQHRGLYHLEKGKWKYLCSAESASAHFSQMSFGGAVGIFKDETPPQIKYRSPQKIQAGIPAEFEITDAGSGIKNAVILLDGKSVKAVSEDSVYSVKAEELTEPGNHDLKIEAYDYSGNKSEHAIQLVILPPAVLSDISVYPNPADDQVTFRYVSNADYVEITVFDVNGDEVVSFDGESAGINEVEWNFKNNDGIDCANGVYIYRVRAFMNGEEFKETGNLVRLK